MVCRALEDDELERVLKIARSWPDPRVWAMFTLLYFAALRAAETVAVRWTDLDYDERALLLVGKGRKEAMLPLSEEVFDALARCPHESEWVFPGRYAGRHMNSNSLRQRVAEVGLAAGVAGGLRPHEIRHTSLAVANDETGDLRAVQTFARHADPRTTSGYTRTRRKKLLAIITALEGTGRIEDRDRVFEERFDVP
jgi:integrase